MEVTQPSSRPFRAEGRKATLDFLSLYSSAQQDPNPPPQGGSLKTHDFLKPLNQFGKKEENNVDVRIVEKPPPPVAAPPHPPPSPSPSMARTLPGGIGSYSISFYDRTLPKKPEGTSLFTVAQASSGGGGGGDRYDDNSNSSSYTSATKKKMGKTGKENINAAGHWTTSLEQLDDQKKNHSFMNMITSSGIDQEKDDEDDEEFVVKKEPSSHSHPKPSLSGKSIIDQKPNTPRSKHSATEQRRRSKINDRFQKLREIIPHSDQKRDKASFLLEVIEYIQYLQEKELKYESSFPGWNHEPSKSMPLANCYRSGDQSQCTTSGSGQALIYPTKIDSRNNNRVGLPQTIPLNGHKKVDLDESNLAAAKERRQQSEVIKQAISYIPQLQQNMFPISGPSNMDTNKTTSHLQSQFLQSKSCTTNESGVPCDHEQTIESGTISISSVYSQGLLNSLTQALQNTGVDMSQASISVQIDLGKKAKKKSKEESDQPFKRLKASRG